MTLLFRFQILAIVIVITPKIAHVIPSIWSKFGIAPKIINDSTVWINPCIWDRATFGPAIPFETALYKMIFPAMPNKLPSKPYIISLCVKPTEY